MPVFAAVWRNTYLLNPGSQNVELMGKFKLQPYNAANGSRLTILTTSMPQTHKMFKKSQNQT